MAVFSFDGSSKVISVLSGTVLDVKDLWSRWSDWFTTSDNSKWTVAMTQIGGNDIDTIAGTSIPIYLYLINDWKIKPMESNHTLSVRSGILLTSDSSDPFISTNGSYMIRVNYQQPIQSIQINTAGSSGTSAAEVWAYPINNMDNSSIGGLVKAIDIKVDDTQARVIILTE